MPVVHFIRKSQTKDGATYEEVSGPTGEQMVGLFRLKR